MYIINIMNAGLRNLWHIYFAKVSLHEEQVFNRYTRIHIDFLMCQCILKHQRLWFLYYANAYFFIIPSPTTAAGPEKATYMI